MLTEGPGMGYARSGRVVAACLAAVLGAATAAAEKLELSDGAVVDGKVLQRDGDRVIIELPRSAFKSVDGQPLPPPVVEGAQAPAFQAVDLDGAPQAVSGADGPVTLVQFWASWCGFCRSDLPTMTRVFSTYNSQGLRVVTVGVDDDVAKLRQFVKAEQIPYPVIPAKDYPQLPDRYDMSGIPAYFLIDRRGAIRRIWRGSLTSGHVDLSAAIADALRDPV